MACVESKVDEGILQTYRSRQFFEGLYTSDAKARSKALETLLAQMLPKEDEEASVVDTKKALVAEHIRTCVHIATECAFPEIRAGFQKVVDFAKQAQLSVPEPSTQPSLFETDHDGTLWQTPSDNPEFMQHLLEDVFVQYGSMRHLERLMGTFPDFLETYFITLDQLMRGDGPLESPLRHYVAIMAASRTGCAYLVRQQEVEFLLAGGDETWLSGVAHASEKIRKLAEINATLAHQPWRMTRGHIERLAEGSDPWSMADLVHAIAIMCTFHCVAGFAFGCGVAPEVDLVGHPTEMCLADDDESAATVGNIERHLSQTDTLAEQLHTLGLQDDESGGDHDQDQEFVRAGEGVDGGCGSVSIVYGKEKYAGDIVMEHEDFNVSSKEYVLMRQHDFCWKAQGMSLVEQFLPELASMLDSEFDFAYNLTRNTLNGKEDVDTLPFRSALWHYVARIKGVCHDDFDYSLVNRLLNIEVKRYVKKLACTPSELRRTEWLNIGYTFQPSEKVHINLLVLESRRQTELLHGLNAIAAYMKPA